MRASSAAADNGDGGLVGHLINAPEARVAAVFSEKNDGRLRSASAPGRPMTSSGVALSLGGGGHPQAAGCTSRAAGRRRGEGAAVAVERC